VYFTKYIYLQICQLRGVRGRPLGAVRGAEAGMARGAGTGPGGATATASPPQTSRLSFQKLLEPAQV